MSIKETDNKNKLEPNYEDDIEELLLNQLMENDKIIVQIQDDCALKLKCMEEKYSTQIHNLEVDLQNYQEILLQNDQHKKFLQGEMNNYDKTNQEMKEEIEVLRDLLRQAEIIEKSNKNTMNKLNIDIKEYLGTIEKLNKKIADLEKNNLLVLQKNESLIQTNLDNKSTLEETEKELKFIKKEYKIIKNEMESYLEENINLKKEYDNFKNEFTNFRNQYKDNIDKQINNLEFDNRKLKKMIEIKKVVSNRRTSVNTNTSSRKLKAETLGLQENTIKEESNLKLMNLTLFLI